MPFLEDPPPLLPSPPAPIDYKGEARILKAVAGGSVALMLVLLALTYMDLRDHKQQEERSKEVQLVDGLFARMRAHIHAAEGACYSYLLQGAPGSLDDLTYAQAHLDATLSELTSALPDSLSTSAKVALRLSIDNMSRSMAGLVQAQRSGRRFMGSPDTLRWRALQDERSALLSSVDEVERRYGRAVDLTRNAEKNGAFGTPLPILLYALIALAGIAILFFRLLHGLERVQAAEQFAREALVTRDREAMIRDRTERNLKRIIDSSPSGIMAFRSERDASGTIIDLRLAMVNAQGAALVDREPSEITGALLSKEIPGLAGEFMFSKLVQVVESGEPLRTEHHYVSKERDAWFDVGAVRLLDGVVTTFTNVTDRRNEQQLLQESQRLAVTGRFARMIAHEIRNPLTNIHLALDQLESDLQTSPEQMPFLVIMKRNAGRIGDLITRMLHSSRPMDVVLMPGGINEVLTEVFDMIKDRCALKDIAVTLDLTKGLSPVLMDRETLVVAFVNLCVNAIEAMQPGVGLLSISSTDAGGRVIVAISDNGKGLSEPEREQVFQPFFSGRKGGMGLGLTEARNILSAHNALLTLESAVGVGTTFILSFSAVNHDRL